MSIHNFTCSQCNENIKHESDISTGYGTDSEGNKICFVCCGKNDLQQLVDLKPGEKTFHYWDGKEITNWPGSLKFKPYYTSKGRHNIARTREDIYFTAGGFNFHAVQYGSFTQIAHIKKLKK